MRVEKECEQRRILLTIFVVFAGVRVSISC